jgi:hypothetical protein
MFSFDSARRRAVLVCALGVLSVSAGAIVFGPVLVSPGANFIGIDYHAPSNQVVVSRNYPTGLPNNFVLVNSAGVPSPFSAVFGLTNEVKIATARSAVGGWTIGELYVGTGVPSDIARVSANGAVITNPWVSLPNEPGLMRGSLHIDRTGNFGNDLIAVTTAGNVWRVTSAGVPTLVASLGTHLEGVCTLSTNPVLYGPWSGRMLVGAEGLGGMFAISPSGVATFYPGIGAEDIDVVPGSQNWFACNYPNTIMGAPASQFAGKVGHVLIAAEFGSPNLFSVVWNGVSFTVTPEGTSSQWEHMCFSPASIGDIPGTTPCRTQGYWKNHPEAWPTNILVLGCELYSQAEMLAILNSSSRGDASLILAKQLIAANLNVLAGCEPSQAQPLIFQADELLCQFSPGKLPYDVKTSSAMGQQMVNLAFLLDAYNNDL